MLITTENKNAIVKKKMAVVGYKCVNDNPKEVTTRSVCEARA